MNILLIDDHELVLQGLSSLVQQMKNVDEVFTVASATEGYDLLKSERIAVILTDLQMPTESGYDVIKTVKRSHPQIKILVVSMVEDSNNIEKALSLGADGFVFKNEKKDILEKAIHTVHGGGQFLSAAIMKVLLNKTSKNSPITSREKEIAIALANGKSNQDVALDLFLSPQTVATHRKNIYRKLNVSNTAALVKYVAEQGWL